MATIKNHLAEFIFSLLALVGIGMSPACYSQTKQTGQCLIVSDIHLDAESKAQVKDLHGHDTNTELLKAAIAQMKKKLPNPAFILIAGDFIRHDAESNGLKDSSMHIIARAFRQAFGDTPVIPVLGNNDAYGGDYVIQDAPFLSMFAKEWNTGKSKVLNDQFKATGYYSYKRGGLKFVVLNSSLLSGSGFKRIKDTIDFKKKATKMMDWLETQLADAKKNDQKVWVMMHIPPGQNMFARLTNSDIEMWRPPFSQIFTDKIVKYASVVRFGIASHIHRNDFRVFYKGDTPVAYMRLIASVSPVYENNPSFEVADFDPSTYRVTKETTYYLDLANIKQNQNVAGIAWGQLSMNSVEGLKNVNASTLSDFIKRFKDVKDLKNNQELNRIFGRYITVYNAGGDISYKKEANLTNLNYSDYLNADRLKASVK